MRKPGVHSGGEFLVVSDPGQHGPQKVPLLLRERRANRVVVCTRHAADLHHRPRAFLGQVNRVDAPVLGVIPPLDEPALLELVEERDEPARHHPQQESERLLADPGVAGDRAQRSSVRGDEIELLEARRKQCGGSRADLRKQKCGPARMR
ncbi:MAG TPA: hypothetical protein VK841_16475 [Polyangiaceae bacterium]|nr:hypothetical protein [Polyangiaceae bacterium]